MTEKPVSLHETPPSQEDLPSAQISQDPLLHPVQAPAQQKEASAGSGTGLFDPYGSFMDTIYTSFLQVSERAESGSDTTPLSYPELPPLLQQTSAPPSLSPRRACSVHNLDLTRLGMETAQSPARGTPKLREDPSTPPPCKPAGVDALSDAPLQPAFMEEAKTDGSSKVCFYSNGISSGMELRGENDEDDVGQSQPGYLSSGERAVDDITSRNAEQERVWRLHTHSLVHMSHFLSAKKSRWKTEICVRSSLSHTDWRHAHRNQKRPQEKTDVSAMISGPSRLFTGVMCCVFMTLFFVISLQRGLDLPGGIDTIIEEPTTTVRPSSVNEYSHQTARLLNLCLMFVCREQCRGRRDPQGERGDVRFDRSHHPTVLHRQHQHCFHGNAPTVWLSRTVKTVSLNRVSGFSRFPHFYFVLFLLLFSLLSVCLWCQTYTLQATIVKA